MNGEQTSQQGKRPTYERCMCRGAMDFMLSMAGFTSEAARQHLRNSRVEFLKAIRTVIDDRISTMQGATASGGTKVNVE